jgi:hypothetical protein
VPSCVLKLESVPEMGYLTENNQGMVINIGHGVCFVLLRLCFVILLAIYLD